MRRSSASKINRMTIMVLVIVFALQIGQIGAQTSSKEEDKIDTQAAAAAAAASTTATNEQQVTTATSPPPTNVPTKPPPNRGNKPPTKKANPPKAQDCPNNCNCSSIDKKISCEGKGLKSLPSLSKLTDYIWISIKNNSIEELDFTKLPLETLEYLDLSQNLIKNFTLPKDATNKINLSKLVTLNLRSNQLKTLNDFAKIKLPALQNLDLSMNPFKSIDASSFNNTKNVEKLSIQQTDAIAANLHEFAFAPMTKLNSLNMSGFRLASFDLGQRQFSNNQELMVLDLTNNSLIEVPRALRSTSSIQRLILNNNLMTSLRNSDFINRTELTYLEIRACPLLSSIDPMTFGSMYELKTLILADNQGLNSISKDSFKFDEGGVNIENPRILELLDLSGNNLTNLENLSEFPSLTFKRVSLNNNPWNCNCNQKWLVTKETTTLRSLVHCKSPSEFKDIEIGQYFATVDCELEENSSHTVIIILFLFFLLSLTIAVVVQKNDLCRRLLFKDQYGTIYYTKASFPPETA